MRSYISERKSLCPGTKFSLSGHSQGAQVVGDSLWYLNANDIIYVALFGDPKLFLPEGLGANPPACTGKRSSYNIWSPNCFTHEGVLQIRRPYMPEQFEGKVGTWCNSRDLICGSSNNPADFSHAVIGHSEYKSNGQMNIMANLIWHRLKDFLPVVLPGHDDTLVPSSQIPMDVAFVFDSTGSMVPFIQSYRDSAAKLAAEVIERGGRIALIEYRDYENQGFPRLRCGFDCTLDRFLANVNNITASSGGDTPEGLLQALMFTYDNLDWRLGANKTAIVLTDAGYHNPDKSGVTYEQVVARSLEIDPVNTYIFANRNQWFTLEFEADLARLAQDTGGFSTVVDSKVDNLPSIFESVHQQIGGRPVAVLPQEFYSGTTLDEFIFDASLSYANQAQITQYEFDFDGDGTYDYSSDTPQATHIYKSPDNYTVVVRITDGVANSATISAPVYVSEPTTSLDDSASSDVESLVAGPIETSNDYTTPMPPPTGPSAQSTSSNPEILSSSFRIKPLFDTTLLVLTIISLIATIIVSVLLIKQPKRTQLLSKETI